MQLPLRPAVIRSRSLYLEVTVGSLDQKLSKKPDYIRDTSRESEAGRKHEAQLCLPKAARPVISPTRSRQR
jgi:hypothetical protein